MNVLTGLLILYKQFHVSNSVQSDAFKCKFIFLINENNSDFSKHNI